MERKKKKPAGYVVQWSGSSSAESPEAPEGGSLFFSVLVAQNSGMRKAPPLSASWAASSAASSASSASWAASPGVVGLVGGLMNVVIGPNEIDFDATRMSAETRSDDLKQKKKLG